MLLVEMSQLGMKNLRIEVLLDNVWINNSVLVPCSCPDLGTEAMVQDREENVFRTGLGRVKF